MVKIKGYKYMRPEQRYKTENPYHIWAYRDDGSKFVAAFKNRREAVRWSRAIRGRLGKVTTAAQPKRKRRPSSPFGIRMPSFRF